MFAVGLILGVLIGGGVVYMRNVNDDTVNVTTNSNKNSTAVVTATTTLIKFSAFDFTAELPTKWYTDKQLFNENDATTTSDDGMNSQLEVSGPEGKVTFIFDIDGIGGGACEEIMSPDNNAEVLAVDTPDIETKAGKLTFCHVTMKDGSETWSSSGNYQKVTPKMLKNKDGVTLSVNADVNAPYSKNREAVLDVIKSADF